MSMYPRDVRPRKSCANIKKKSVDKLDYRKGEIQISKMKAESFLIKYGLGLMIKFQEFFASGVIFWFWAIVSVTT